MIYGTVEFEWSGTEMVAELTEDGWKIPGMEPIAGALDALAGPREFGPADGDPMACAIARAAEILKGKGHVVPLPGPPPGTVY